MLKRFALYLILGVACYNLAAQEQSGQVSSSEGIRAGISDESEESENGNDQESGEEQVALERGNRKKKVNKNTERQSPPLNSDSREVNR